MVDLALPLFRLPLSQPLAMDTLPKNLDNALCSCYLLHHSLLILSSYQLVLRKSQIVGEYVYTYPVEQGF